MVKEVREVAMSRGSWVLGAVVFVSLLAQAQGAWAQSVSDEGEVDAATGRKIQYQQLQEIDFTELLRLEGKLVGPDGKIHMEPLRKGFNPLIKLRNDWNPEMRSSIDDIK